MSLVLLILKIFIPIDTTSRLIAILITALYAFIGAVIYVTITFKTQTIKNIFGIANFKEVFKILSRKKKIN